MCARAGTGATSTGCRTGTRPPAVCAAKGAWGFDEMDKLQPTHFHKCPRCGAETEGYRERGTCEDGSVRWCGKCLSKLFRDVKIIAEASDG